MLPYSCSMCTDTYWSFLWVYLFHYIGFLYSSTFLVSFFVQIHQKLKFILISFCEFLPISFSVCSFVKPQCLQCVSLLWGTFWSSPCFLVYCTISAADLRCEASHWSWHMGTGSWCLWTSCRLFSWIDNLYQFSFFFKSVRKWVLYSLVQQLLFVSRTKASFLDAYGRDFQECWPYKQEESLSCPVSA